MYEQFNIVSINNAGKRHSEDADIVHDETMKIRSMVYFAEVAIQGILTL